MSKKLSLLLIVLLIVPLAIGACGDDDKKDDNKAADLKQELTATSGLTVKYPDGWAARESDMGIEIANKAEYLDSDVEEVPEGAAVLMIMAPFNPADMGMGDMALKDLVGMMSEDEGSDVSEPKDTKVGGKDAARVDIKEPDSKTEGFFVAYKIDDTNVVIAMGAAREGQLDKQEATLFKILESLTYTAPAQ